MTVSDAVVDGGMCRLPRDAAAAVGVTDGQQVRLRYDGDPAVFTVAVHDDEAGAVSAAGRDRLGATTDRFRVDADPNVVHPTLDRETAAETGEFVERLIDGDSGIVALAPHGGYIEHGTDRQVTRLSSRLGATGWYCAGWWPGGGAYRRWHVTSTRIDPRSFPELEGIEDVGFDTTVGFHGWRNDYLGIGGTASLELRTAIRDELEAAVDGAFAVRLATDPARNGTATDNVVNWLTDAGTGGVQLEQPLVARTEYRDAVVDAVADVLARRIA
ncbi:hypothetical protein DU502_03120 [Haloplanus aerogenes]|nr:hypothetical protein DU502_03120 [Haloplanus aerogenes]